MKTKISIVLLILFGLACEEEYSPPSIYTQLSPLFLDDHSIGEVYDFDILITNRGDEVLKIERIEVKGDETCAFKFEGPDINELGKDQYGFIRGFYQPQVQGYHQIALHVISNAEDYPDFIIPVCAIAIPAGSSPPTETLPKCSAPPETQPDCLQTSE